MSKIEVTNTVEIRTNIRLDEIDLIQILTKHFGLRVDAAIDIAFYQDSLELSHVVRDVKCDELANEDAINRSVGGKTFFEINKIHSSAEARVIADGILKATVKNEHR